MIRLTTRLLLATLVALSLTTHVLAENDQQTVEKVLVILSDDSLQTQGMAMVLSNTMSDQGAEVNVLLCDSAGDLALSSYEAEALKPKDLTPGQMLRRLMKEGASVSVCALYLPNSEHTKDDLLDGVNVATPPDMAAQMLDPGYRVFSF
ncbi:DsrE family protein [Marinobacter salicampi]|uniref:DsrE family protein n=1 Tax=Marinobacter salicampi TaxID=435907 RepID=UPI00140C5FF2|nr:DsrE family protein [Marinobacter salicampi]